MKSIDIGLERRANLSSMKVLLFDWEHFIHFEECVEMEKQKKKQRMSMNKHNDKRFDGDDWWSIVIIIQVPLSREFMF